MDRKLRLAAMPRAGCHAAMMAAALLLVPAGVRAQAQPEPARLPYPADPALDTAPPPPQKTDEEKKLEKAGNIATQPVRDVGLNNASIPRALQEALAAPYMPPKREDCRWLNWELARLNQALGPDFDVDGKPREDKVEQIAFAGGEMLVNSIIPFRGLVREISGAGPADRRKAAAVNAGLARRGYMRGLAQAKGCAPSSYVMAK